MSLIPKSVRRLLETIFFAILGKGILILLSQHEIYPERWLIYFTNYFFNLKNEQATAWILIGVFGIIGMILLEIIWHYYTLRTIPLPNVLLLYQNSQLQFINHNRYTLYLWGSKFDGYEKNIEKDPREVKPNTFYYFLTENLKAEAIKKIGSNQNSLIPFEIYFSSNKKSYYIAKFNLLIKNNNGNLSIHTQQLGVTKAKHF